MFTGLITDIGTVKRIDLEREERVIEITTAFDLTSIAHGASIACNGVCLTLIDKSQAAFTVHASPETLSKTTVKEWTIGSRVNLEQSVRLGERLEGHLVYGHVDAIARCERIEAQGQSQRLEFSCERWDAGLLVPKGAVALDGVSLTVAEIEDQERFSVTVIPHTALETTLGQIQVYDRVNLEYDMLGRYVRQWMIERL